MSVVISFIEKIGDDENFVLTSELDVYPSYKQGDVIWIQKTNHEDESKAMKTRGYTIIDVQHSIREMISSRFKTKENFLGIKNYLGMEVYLKREE